jgi:hypothetical protein
MGSGVEVCARPNAEHPRSIKARSRIFKQHTPALSSSLVLRPPRLERLASCSKLIRKVLPARMSASQSSRWRMRHPVGELFPASSLPSKFALHAQNRVHLQCATDDSPVLRNKEGRPPSNTLHINDSDCQLSITVFWYFIYKIFVSQELEDKDPIHRSTLNSTYSPDERL